VRHLAEFGRSKTAPLLGFGFVHWDLGLSMVPHGEVTPQSDEAVRGCGQTGARCLRFRVFPIGGCV